MKKLMAVILAIAMLVSFWGMKRDVVKANSGLAWTLLKGSNAGGRVFSVAVDPNNNKVLYAATYRGVLKSTDGGETWSNVLSTNNEAYSVVVNSSSSVIVGTHWQIIKSDDGGRHWNKVNDHGGESMIVDPLNPQVMYAYGTYEILKSIDGGSSWMKLIGTSEIKCIAIDPKDSNTIYYGTPSSGVYKTTDSFHTVTNVTSGLPLYGGNAWPYGIYALLVDPVNTNIVYAGTQYDGVYKSTDGGQNWKPTELKNLRVNYIAYDPSDSKAVYIGTEKGMFKSTDQCTTFTGIGLQGAYINFIAFDSTDHAIYAATDNGIYKAYTIQYTITASAHDGGKITPSGPTLVYKASSATFNIVPDSGYKVKDIIVDGISMGPASSYTFNNVTSDHTIEAVFEKSSVVIVLQVGKYTFTVNGKQRSLDAPPIIKNGRTLVPIRPIIEALGGTVGWDSFTQKVTITFGQMKIELIIGKSVAIVNGTSKYIDPSNPSVVPIIYNGRTMLPLRFILENLGCQVKWDGSTQTITITYGG
jgi:photosystem II stability/assembly factor-like uncharacterized protein